MSRIFAAILLIAVLAIGGGLIATSAYQAGLHTAVTTVATDGATVVTPVVVPGYGYGYGWGFGGPGFGFFGFLFGLFFLFLIFGLIRAMFWRGRGYGRGWGPGGYGGWGKDWGPGGPNDPSGTNPWQSRAHQTFDDWHREAHVGSGGPSPSSPAGTPGGDPTNPTNPSGDPTNTTNPTGGPAAGNPA
jgi:hypothetical protein